MVWLFSKKYLFVCSTFYIDKTFGPLRPQFALWAEKCRILAFIKKISLVETPINLFRKNILIKYCFRIQGGFPERPGLLQVNIFRFFYNHYHYSFPINFLDPYHLPFKHNQVQSVTQKCHKTAIPKLRIVPAQLKLGQLVFQALWWRLKLCLLKLCRAAALIQLYDCRGRLS